jgi:hypothetical protein
MPRSRQPLMYVRTPFGVMNSSLGKRWPLFFHALGPNRIAVRKGHLIGVAHLLPICESKAVLHGTQCGRIHVGLTLVSLKRLTSRLFGRGAQFMVNLDLAILRNHVVQSIRISLLTRGEDRNHCRQKNGKTGGGEKDHDQSVQLHTLPKFASIPKTSPTLTLPSPSTSPEHVSRGGNMQEPSSIKAKGSKFKAMVYVQPEPCSKAQPKGGKRQEPSSTVALGSWLHAIGYVHPGTSPVTPPHSPSVQEVNPP